MHQQAQLHNPTVVSIEDRASGTQLIQELVAEGFSNVRPYEPAGTDKIMRLFGLTGLFEARRVVLPRSASWLTEYVRELISFPGSKHDDQVDSTTQALEQLRSRRPSIYDLL